jgi:hypothetical protein
MGAVPWDEADLRRAVRAIYNYRSLALHDGRPIPAPMCEAPHVDPAWAAPAERMISLGSYQLGSTWLKEDIPFNLHCFEYLTRATILCWWRSQIPETTRTEGHGMKVDSIKQIFLEFVRRLPEPGMTDPGTNAGPQLLPGAMIIRGDLIMRDELAHGYLDALEKMHDIASEDETWNKDDVDDLFAKHVLAVVTAATVQRPAVIVQAAKAFAAELNEAPADWQIDLSVFGANYDLHCLSFGKIAFLADNIRSPYPVPGLIESNIDTAFLLARLSVQAINRKTVVEKASEIVDQHLNVVNALCAESSFRRERTSSTSVPL